MQRKKYERAFNTNQNSTDKKNDNSEAGEIALLLTPAPNAFLILRIFWRQELHAAYKTSWNLGRPPLRTKESWKKICVCLPGVQAHAQNFSLHESGKITGVLRVKSQIMIKGSGFLTWNILLPMPEECIRAASREMFTGELL